MLAITSNWEANQVAFPRFKNYQNRENVYRQGEVSEGFYLVKLGSVKLQKILPNGNQTILKIMSPGEIFGEGESRGTFQRQNNSFAIALQDGTHIQKITNKNLLDPTLGAQLQEKLLAYNLETTQRLERLNWMDAEGRIKFTLRDLAQKLGKRFGDETLLKLNLTHEDFALLTDSSRQTVTKTLSFLKKEGIITYSRNRILFRNLATFNS